MSTTKTSYLCLLAFEISIILQVDNTFIIKEPCIEKSWHNTFSGKNYTALTFVAE